MLLGTERGGGPNEYLFAGGNGTYKSIVLGENGESKQRMCGERTGRVNQCSVGRERDVHNDIVSGRMVRANICCRGKNVACKSISFAGKVTGLTNQFFGGNGSCKQRM